MAIIVTITGIAGLASSFVMLKAGVTSMAWRYPLAVAIAYAVFLAALWVWLRQHRLFATRRRRRDWVQFDFGSVDVVDMPFSVGPATPADAPDFTGFGQGGGFAGGGGGSSWGGGNTSVAPRVDASATSGHGGGGGIDIGLDLDEGAWILVLIAIVALIALSIALYVVYIAPALFAELLLDVALSAGLYRQLLRIEGRHWLTSALRHTILPAALVGLLIGLLGSAMQDAYPDLHSIGPVLERATAESRRQAP